MYTECLVIQNDNYMKTRGCINVFLHQYFGWILKSYYFTITSIFRNFLIDVFRYRWSIYETIIFLKFAVHGPVVSKPTLSTQLNQYLIKIFDIDILILKKIYQIYLIKMRQYSSSSLFTVHFPVVSKPRSGSTAVQHCNNDNAY